MSNNKTTDGCFRTLTGLKFSLTDPKPEMITIEDIAAGLAHKGHYSGLTPKYFSIAEHCLLTERLFANTGDLEDYELRLIALLHDASEAYIGDIIRPLKDLVPEFRNIENKIHEAIFKKFDLPIERLSEIKEFDNQSQDLEASVFYHNGEHSMIKYMTPQEARDNFTGRFMFLEQKRVNQIRNSRIEYDPLIPQILEFFDKDEVTTVTQGLIMQKFMIGFNRTPIILEQMVKLGHIEPTDNPLVFNVTDK